jgi:predicted phosphodiesterase
MARTEHRKADAILSSDGHFRDDCPECRKEGEFFVARNRKVAFLKELQEKHDCVIIDGGDLFNKWQVSSELEGWSLLNLPNRIVTVPGNHDLPNHSIDLYKKSSLHVLEAAKKVTVLKNESVLILNESKRPAYSVHGFPFGGEDEWVNRGTAVVIVHTYAAEAVPSFMEGYTPSQLLAALPGYKLIVTGDHHASFVYKVNDRQGNKRLVVNPGSMMRTTADQVNYRPCVYLWYFDTNEVEPIYFPIEQGVVSREHIKKKEERNDRMEAFISRLNTDVEIGMSFENNMEKYIAKNKISSRTKELIWEAIDGK